MRQSRRNFALAIMVAAMAAIPCMAQDVELPFTWQGKGVASTISENGIEDTDFEFELSIDEQGMVDGKTSSTNGIAGIKHVFAAEAKQYDWPGYFTRKIVIVMLIDESGGNPMLGIVSGRILMDKFLYGEMMLAQYQPGSDTARVLGVGNPQVTLIEGDDLPSSLKSTLDKCFPIGTAKIEGGYKKASANVEADSGTITLFNESGLKDGYVYLKDSSAEDVWKVQDGVLSCTGVPTGFLRTKEQYGDYKLVFEWRWPEKPGNSGVLLRMSGEEKIWPLCMEAQLMHQRAGDFVGMGCGFNENKAPKGGPVSYTPRMNESNEKQIGDWNKYEILCKGGTIEVKINGQIQNKATGVTVSKGYIGLQSEGVPIMFRNVKLTPLN